MPDPRDPPPTEEGWYALHDFRRIDWDAWRDATERERERALDEAIAHLEPRLAVEDAEEGDSALYSVLGHEADLLLLHLRPSSADVGALERQFEATEFAGYTERTTSFVSVTEASGYSERAREYFEGDLDENSGLANYIQTRLKPTIPDATHVCFYPMDKRRQPGQNWYDLPFEERADHMEAHGDIGRDYGGRVVQMITGAIALDDWEWGVTLWGDDLVDMKDLLYEMRFDPSTSQFAEFGSFYVGRRFPPADLPALLAGDRVPTGGEAATETSHHETSTEPDHDEASHHETPMDSDHHEASAEATHHEESAGATHHEESAGATHDEQSAEASHHGEDESAESSPMSQPPNADSDDDHGAREDDDMATRIRTLGLHEGSDYDAGDYSLVLYSGADAQELAAEVDDLRGNFEHYDSHVRTVVRAQSGRSAIVSIWTTERAADTALGFLTDLPGVTESWRGQLGEATDHDEADGADHDEADGTDHDAGDDADAASMREALADLDIYAGQPHGEDVYALVLYSTAALDVLESEVEQLRSGFDRYDTHEGTQIYTDPDSGTAAVVSLWETADAADTASGYLEDLPGIVGWADDTDGFGTMGMFYTVKPEHRDAFVEKFGTVADLLEGMDGHRESALLVNTDDENNMFIASQWDSRDDAMAFFRSDAFSDTVDWGRDILADRPRHVFFA